MLIVIELSYVPLTLSNTLNVEEGCYCLLNAEQFTGYLKRSLSVWVPCSVCTNLQSRYFGQSFTDLTFSGSVLIPSQLTQVCTNHAALLGLQLFHRDGINRDSNYDHPSVLKAPPGRRSIQPKFHPREAFCVQFTSHWASGFRRHPPEVHLQSWGNLEMTSCWSSGWKVVTIQSPSPMGRSPQLLEGHWCTSRPCPTKIWAMISQEGGGHGKRKKHREDTDMEDSTPCKSQPCE